MQLIGRRFNLTFRYNYKISHFTLQIKARGDNRADVNERGRILLVCFDSWMIVFSNLSLSLSLSLSFLCSYRGVELYNGNALSALVPAGKYELNIGKTFAWPGGPFPEGVEVDLPCSEFLFKA
jgi:hypothetical protein